MNKKKTKKRGLSTNLISGLLIIAGAAAIVYCAYLLIQDRLSYSQGGDYYASVSAMRTVRPAANAKPESVNTPAVSSPASDESTKPEEWSPYVDFEALGEIIPDLVAWINCEGTPIDYPVVQGSDNDYYLKRLPDGTVNKIGSIFIDYRNPADFTDGNTVIYGHRLNSGDMMFSTLESYKTQAYYDEHPVFELHTPETDYIVEVFAGYVVDALRETLPRGFDSDAEFEAYVDEISRRSVFSSGIKPVIGDRLVSLCTCTTNSSNSRFVLVGRIT